MEKPSCTSNYEVRMKHCREWDHHGIFSIYQLVQDFFHPQSDEKNDGKYVGTPMETKTFME